MNHPAATPIPSDPRRSALRRFTRAEYDRLVALGLFQGEPLQLLHGEIVRMSPIGAPHSSVVDRLNELLLPSLLKRARVRIQQPFAAGDASEPEPDVAVVPQGDYSARHPDRAHLVVEVADSSLDLDRNVKAPIYAASGVPEYWIVNLVEQCVDVYRDPDQGAYRSVQRVKRGGSVSPAAFPDVVLAVDALLP